MIKPTNIIIAICMIFLLCLPTMAEGYNVLVIPNSCIDVKKKNLVGNVDIEELLARKFVDKLEMTGKAYSPSVRILKISIKNNPDFKSDAIDSMNNVRVLSNSYGVPKVMLISSKIEQRSHQKTVQNRLDLPILTPQNATARVVTKITMYNIKNDEIIWSDVYYKNLDSMSVSKIETVNNYYDELIAKVINGMRESKETHAIMLTNVPKSLDKTKKEIKPTDNKLTMEQILQFPHDFVSKLKNKKANQKPKKIVKKLSKPEKVAAVTPTPDLRMKEDTSLKKKQVKKENSVKKWAESVQAQYKLKKQEREIAKVNKLLNPKQKPEKVKKAETKPTKVKEVNSEKISINQWFKEKYANFVSSRKEKKSEGFISKIKSKYNNFKAKNNEKKEQKIRNSEENVKFSNVILNEKGNTSSAKRYLQTKPRNNSVHYTPQFDTSVNDI